MASFDSSPIELVSFTSAFIKIASFTSAFYQVHVPVGFVVDNIPLPYIVAARFYSEYVLYRIAKARGKLSAEVRQAAIISNEKLFDIRKNPHDFTLDSYLLPMVRMWASVLSKLAEEEAMSPTRQTRRHAPETFIGLLAALCRVYTLLNRQRYHDPRTTPISDHPHPNDLVTDVSQARYAMATLGYYNFGAWLDDAAASPQQTGCGHFFTFNKENVMFCIDKPSTRAVAKLDKLLVAPYIGPPSQFITLLRNGSGKQKVVIPPLPLAWMLLSFP
ncbi:hypothetical protein GGR53DRAFT_462623 [Hypoxylon sp. FL1150]|nr:hypothetical protein GGR53DRAFT_462623 [Hypoxylon sp. FL1150]